MHISLTSQENSLKISKYHAIAYLLHIIMVSKCPHFAIFYHVTLHVLLGLKSQITIFILLFL